LNVLKYFRDVSL